MLWNVSEWALRDSVLFSAIQTVISTLYVYCTYGSARTFSHLNYKNLCCILGYQRFSFVRFEGIKFGEVRLGEFRTPEVLSVWFVSFSILLFTFYVSYMHAQYSGYGHHSRRRKRRRGRYRVSPSVFKSIWISRLNNVLKRAGNSTARFRFVFSTTDCPL